MANLTSGSVSHVAKRWAAAMILLSSRNFNFNVEFVVRSAGAESNRKKRRWNVLFKYSFLEGLLTESVTDEAMNGQRAIVCITPGSEITIL